MATAGNMHSINCTVQKINDGLLNSPIAKWTVRGEPVTITDDITISTPFLNTSILTFNPLKTSHGNNYTCLGILSSPALSEHQLSLENHQVVKVQSKLIYVPRLDVCVHYFLSVPPPMVAISIPDSSLYAGTTISVTCNVTINNAVNSNVSVNVTWLRENTQLFDDTDRVTISPTLGTMRSFTSILTLSPLSDVDNTSFTCKALAYSSHSLKFIETSSVGEHSVSISVMLRC